jgi:hypothetical protein
MNAFGSFPGLLLGTSAMSFMSMSLMWSCMQPRWASARYWGRGTNNVQNCRLSVAVRSSSGWLRYHLCHLRLCVGLFLRTGSFWRSGFLFRFGGGAVLQQPQTVARKCTPSTRFLRDRFLRWLLRKWKATIKRVETG